MIEKITGPACPSCGCENSRVIKRHNRWNRNRSDERRQCNHCGRKFSSKAEGSREEAETELPEAGVTYTLCRCPVCDSHDVPAIKTIRSEPPVVHKRRCRDCNHIFKSSAQ